MEFIRLIVFLFFLGSGLLSCNLKSQEKQQQPEKDKIEVEYLVIGAQEFKERLNLEKDAQLIDVRTKTEFDGGSIEQALNYDFLDGTFEKSIDKLNQSKPVYVFCAKGGRSGKASQLLKQKGFTRIIDLQGGYSAWTQYENQ